MHLLSEQSPTQYHWLLLQSDLGGGLPQIKIWTMFYPELPEDKSLPFLFPDDPPRSYAAQLLQAAESDFGIVDSYKQPVGLGRYNPNYMRVEQDFLRTFLGSKKQPEDERLVNAGLLSRISPSRSSLEFWEFRLLNSYRFLRHQARADISGGMSARLWDNYILKLMMNVTKTRTMSQAGPEEAELVESALNSNLQRVQRGSLLKLDRIRFWKEAGSWKYSEIVSLCRAGLPKELRPSIWSELFGLAGTRNPGFEESKHTKYREYITKSQSADSVVYRQMERDVLDIAKSTDQLHTERAGVLRVAKAYYAWCLDENRRPDESGGSRQSFYGIYAQCLKRVGYFKGIMHLTQKVWQLFPETEAFWCVVGFARALPYVFQSRDVMTGQLSWSHKLMLLAISTVIEKQYPDMYRAVLRHGLPIEYYVSDKLFTMLSTVYPTETLLRLYDIIALEAASEAPIRAAWVLVTGCIMLFTLNEPYVRAARSAEEIELLVDNTGINNLSTQKIVEMTCELSGRLFATYNPGWQRLLAVVIGKEDSVVGMELAWTKKANELDARYGKVKELNGEVSRLLQRIRAARCGGNGVHDDSDWMSKFVKDFSRYCNESARSEVADRLFLYVYKCCNVGPDVSSGRVLFSPNDKQIIYIAPDGTVNQMLESSGKAETVQILIPDVGCCEIDVRNYESDMPIAIDEALFKSKPSAASSCAGKDGPKYEVAVQHRGQTPQPFVSVVLLVSTKEKGEVDEAYKFIKKTMTYESKIVFAPREEALRKQVTGSVEKEKESIDRRFLGAGLQSVYLSDLTGPQSEDSTNDKLALRRLMSSLLGRETDPEAEELSRQAHDTFAKYYDGRLPLKRVLVSLIASAALTAYDKLSLCYDICSALSGVSHSLLLRDAIELMQLLYELHLIYIPAECLPHLVEHVMTSGGVNLITDAFLLSKGVDSGRALQFMHTTGGSALDKDAILRATRNVQEAFARYWELWGYKQVFASGPHSFCGTLNTVLGGYQKRPARGGPYRLVICYKHRGQAFYKELEYDKAERLVIAETRTEERRALLTANRNNLSFVGERIHMTKDEFIARVNRLPILTELMRIHVSLRSELAAKHPLIGLTINLEREKRVAAVVRFSQTQSSANCSYDAKGTLSIQLGPVHMEDLLAEIKSQVIDAIAETQNGILPSEHCEALDVAKYLNDALQFFDRSGQPLDDYERLAEGHVMII